MQTTSTMPASLLEEERVQAEKCAVADSSTVEKVDVQNVKAASTATAVSCDSNNEKDAEENNDTKEEDTTSLIQQADALYADDKLLASARLLRQVKQTNNSTLLTPQHQTILHKASDCESLINQLTKPPEEGWTKLGERHDGKHNSMIYYNIENNTKLHTRIETPIPSSLLVPLLSVLNESELYATWLPYFKNPFKLGVSSTTKLQQSGRASQIIQVGVDVPWPIAKREVVIDAISLDDIEATGRIAIRLNSPDDSMDDGVVPKPKKGVVRQDFKGGFLFCKCPPDHPSLVDTTATSGSNNNNEEEEEEEKILVYFTTTNEDDKLNLFPQALINFVTRVVVGKMWDMFLRVAEEVKDGKRPQHSEAIQQKRDTLYDWVDERIEAMFERLKTEEGEVASE